MYNISNIRVALVHYWLVGMRGGEKVLEALCEIFPKADIFTHVLSPSAISERLQKHTTHTSFINRLPGAAKHYQKYLPLMPLALKNLDFSGYDLIISSESGPAKGVTTPPNCPHICYCHTPMRYVWNMYREYKAQAGPITKILMPPLCWYLRRWDRATSSGVDVFLANSNAVRQRIADYYKRDAKVVFPPVDTDYFTPSWLPPEDFYLVCGQLVGYKRVDLAIEAFNQNGRPLTVIGGGEMYDRLRKSAKSNITFLGQQPIEVLKDHFQRCRALIFPGEEDFGIVPVEAMASGRPVIALGKGGALDTVLPGKTGILFNEQSAAALLTAIETFECGKDKFSPDSIRDHALTFSRDRFRQNILAIVSDILSAKKISL